MSTLVVSTTPWLWTLQTPISPSFLHIFKVVVILLDQSSTRHSIAFILTQITSIPHPLSFKANPPSSTPTKNLKAHKNCITVHVNRIPE